MSEEAVTIIGEIDRTVHAPARLTILSCLAVVKVADFTFLLNQTGLTRGNLSVNLGKLEEAGYVGIRKDFVNRMPRTLIRLTAKGRRAMQAYAKQMQQVLDGLSG
ncbi:MAG: winged helix-turn-helix domain-containing protein [Puniceicoccaceae bacterium]